MNSIRDNIWIFTLDGKKKKKNTLSLSENVHVRMNVRPAPQRKGNRYKMSECNFNSDLILEIKEEGNGGSMKRGEIEFSVLSSWSHAVI